MQAKLVIIAGSTKQQDIKLRLPAVLGRGRACSIQLPQPLISRQHCEIYADGDKLLVRDLGSLNGTLVNNERVTETELLDGMLLTIGSVTFRVEIEEELPDGPLRNPWTNRTSDPATAKNAGALTTPTPAASPLAPTPLESPASAPPQKVGDLIGLRESSDFTERAIAPLRPTTDAAADAPPDAARQAGESSIHADELLPPSVSAAPAGAAPAATPTPVPIPVAPNPVAPNPVAPNPVAPNLAVPPLATPVATPIAPPGGIPVAAPLASPVASSVQPPAAHSPPSEETDEDLQAFLKSLGSNKKK
ncbi:MAG: FHA domain-containing protein [Pirellulales bacterium]